MPELKEVFAGLLSTAYQMDETGVASLYNEDGSLKDDALQTILSKDQERVTALKGDVKKIGEDNYSRGRRETIAATENEIREIFGIKETGKKGRELIEAGRDFLIANSGKVTEEQIKKSPIYLSLEQRVTSDVEKANKDWEAKLNTEISKYERERTLSEVVDYAGVLLQEFKPVLSPTPKVAKKQLERFNDDVRSLNYETKTLDDGKKKYLLLDKDGKRIEDAHGNPVSFEAKIKEIAENNFDLQAAEARNGAGDPNKKGDGDGGNFEFKKPANRDELNKLLSEVDAKYPTNLKDRAEAKKKIMELFNKA